MNKEVKRSILYGYECEIDTFADVCKALSRFNFDGLHSSKKAELSDKIKNIQKELSEECRKQTEGKSTFESNIYYESEYKETQKLL